MANKRKRVTPEMVAEMKAMRKQGITAETVAQQFGVHKSTVAHHAGAKLLQLQTTNSETSCFRKCPAAWGFEYVELLRPKRRPRHFMVGDAVHVGLAWWILELWRNRNAERVVLDGLIKQAAEKARIALTIYHAEQEEVIEGEGYPVDGETLDEWNADRDMVESMIRLHCARYVDEDRETVPILIEQPFSVPVRDSRGRKSHLYHDGVIDWLFYDPAYDELVLCDHKTSADDPAGMEKRLEFDPQIAGYLYAVREMLIAGELQWPEGHELAGKPLSPPHAHRARALQRPPEEDPERTEGQHERPRVEGQVRHGPPRSTKPRSRRRSSAGMRSPRRRWSSCMNFNNGACAPSWAGPNTIDPITRSSAGPATSSTRPKQCARRAATRRSAGATPARAPWRAVRRARIVLSASMTPRKTGLNTASRSIHTRKSPRRRRTRHDDTRRKTDSSAH